MSIGGPSPTDNEIRGGGDDMPAVHGNTVCDKTSGAKSVEGDGSELHDESRTGIVYQRNPSKFGLHIGNWGGAHRTRRMLYQCGPQTSRLPDLGLT